MEGTHLQLLLTATYRLFQKYTADKNKYPCPES